jgi:uncharacterized RDD family membrane protein YckC
MQPDHEPQYPSIPGTPFEPAEVVAVVQDEYAPWIIRVAGYLIDLLPVVILSGVAQQFIPYGRNMSDYSGGRWLGYVLFYLAALVVWFYNRCYLAGTTGQSWGKSIMGTLLFAESTGAPIGTGKAFLRDICHILDAILYIGFLWPLWDRKRQTFADKIIKTVVVRP